MTMRLPPKTKTSNCIYLAFPPYSDKELTDILKVRAQESLNEEVGLSLAVTNGKRAQSAMPSESSSSPSSSSSSAAAAAAAALAGAGIETDARIEEDAIVAGSTSRTQLNSFLRLASDALPRVGLYTRHVGELWHSLVALFRCSELGLGANSTASATSSGSTDISKSRKGELNLAVQVRR